jgi:hypothetical protein
VIPNAHVTIYNRYIHTDRSEKWQRSEIFNCVWQGVSAIARFKEQVPANTILILIPFASGAGYAEPKAWQASKASQWTLQEGDVIVRGLVTDEIDTEYTITSLRAEHQHVVQIASVAAMDEGSPNVQHWEVQAK